MKSQPEPLKYYRKQTAEAERLHFHHAIVNISITEVGEQSKDLFLRELLLLFVQLFEMNRSPLGNGVHLI